MHTMFRRAVIVAGSAMIAATTLTTVAPAQSAPRAAVVAPRPILTVGHVADSVTLQKYGAKVDLALGVYAVAGDEAFEVRAHRPSYFQPIEASLITTTGDIALPPESMNNFSKIKDFFGLRIFDHNDRVVYGRSLNFCPDGEEVRIRPDAPAAQGYPEWCPFNPYTKGGVYGVDAGYATAVLGDYGTRAPLDLGRYTAKVWMAQPYRDLLGVNLADATTTVHVHVTKPQGGNCVSQGLGCKSATPPAALTPKAGAVSAKPNASRPSGSPMANIAAEIKPDLRSLPAYAVSLRHGFISFAATVWNSGTSPLVVDGFRRPDEDVMDAFQYFFDADGNQVGFVPAGSMEWDPRQGHQHWHFRDFARYRLLDADKNAIVRSRKEAFCLANTDAVDYTVEGANWRPYNTDLHTSCGSYTAMAVREVLDCGSGDTYFQNLPGQSFNIKDLPNGKYFISVEANPKNVMQELSTTNNISYRKIFLKGTGDSRRVVVPQVGIIKETGGYY